MIGVFESKFLQVTIICSVPTLSVLTVKIMITRRSLESKLNTNVRTGMRVQLFRILNICDKYYKLKVGSNVTHGDGVYCDRNVRQMKWTRRIGFFVPRLQMQRREFSRVFSVSK